MLGGYQDAPGRRTIDATPAFDAYRDTTCDEIADRLEEIADASIHHSLTTLVLQGPRVLYRFCHGDDARALNAGAGSWWTHEDAIGKGVTAGRAVSKTARKGAFQSVMRERLAVKVDWNKMTSIRTLRIPTGVSVRVMASLAAPQSEAANAGRYGGGGIQYVLALSLVIAQGIYPSEPEPLVRFLAGAT